MFLGIENKKFNKNRNVTGLITNIYICYALIFKNQKSSSTAKGENFNLLWIHLFSWVPMFVDWGKLALSWIFDFLDFKKSAYNQKQIYNSLNIKITCFLVPTKSTINWIPKNNIESAVLIVHFENYPLVLTCSLIDKGYEWCIVQSTKKF